jgi:hypothetical protein
MGLKDGIFSDVCAWLKSLWEVSKQLREDLTILLVPAEMFISDMEHSRRPTECSLGTLNFQLSSPAPLTSRLIGRTDYSTERFERQTANCLDSRALLDGTVVFARVA